MPRLGQFGLGSRGLAGLRRSLCGWSRQFVVRQSALGVVGHPLGTVAVRHGRAVMVWFGTACFRSVCPGLAGRRHDKAGTVRARFTMTG